MTKCFKEQMKDSDVSLGVNENYNGNVNDNVECLGLSVEGLGMSVRG